jgi:DNA-binding NtrC family response regulator
MSNTSTPITVLSVSADLGLSHTRELLLANNGCEVKTSLSKSHAQQLMQSQSFDVLVCGNSLVRDVCQELAKDFRARNPRGKIIEVLSARWNAPMNQPDATAVDPGELVAKIHHFARYTSEPMQQKSAGR